MRVVKRLLVVTAWSSAVVVALLASAVYHAQLPLARRIVRDAVNAFVTSEIRGELAIGRLDQVQLDHIVARWVVLYDANGRRVIVADRIDLYPDFAALGRNTLHFRAAQLRGGFVRMVEGPDGAPSWITALEPQLPGAPSADPLRAQIDRIELSDVTVYGDYLGLTNFRVADVRALGHLDIHDEVTVKIERGSGTFVRPFPYPGLVDEITGVIDTAPMRGVDLHIVARRERSAQSLPAAGDPQDERVTAHVTYKSPATNTPQDLRVVVETEEVSPDSLRGLGYDWIGPIETPLRGRVELFGPPLELTLEADIDSAAGRAHASGLISDTRGISVRLVTDALEVETLFPDAPALTLEGSLHIAVPDTEADPRVHLELASTRYKGLVIPAFELDGLLQEGRLLIERARSTQGGRLSMRGVVSYDGGTDLRVEASLPAVHRNPNVARYVESLEGALRADLRVQVPAGGRYMDVEGRVELTDARYTSLAASRVVVSGRARGDPRLPRVDLRVQGDEVRVLGYRLGAARFSLRGGPREYLAQGEFSPSEGRKTFYFDAKVAANRRQLVIQADPIEFVVGDKTFRGAARDLAIVHGDSVELGLLRLASGPERLEARGILRLNGEDNLRADLQNFDLAALRALLGDRFPLEQGHADATVELRGDVDQPELLLQGAMRGGTLLEVSNVDAMYFITYKDGALELDTQVEVAGRGSIHVAGQSKLDPDISEPWRALERGRYDLEVTSTDFDLEMFPQLRSVIHQGRVGGTLQIRGQLEAPTVTGQVTVDGLCLPGTTPFDLRSELDYDGARATAALEITDEAGALASARIEAGLSWEHLRDAPREVPHRIRTGDWRIVGHTQSRPLADLPLQLPEGARLPFAVGSRFSFEHAAGGTTRGSMRVVAQSLEQFTDPTCKLTAASQWTAAMKLDGDQVSAVFRGVLDGDRVLKGEARLAVPIDRWLAGTGVLRIERADVSGEAAFEDIQRVPVLCRHGRGDLHVEARLEGLFTPAQRARVDLYGSLNPHVRVLEGRQRRVIESCLDDPARVWMQIDAEPRKATAQGWLEGCYGGHTDLAVEMPLRWTASGAPAIDGDRDTRVQLDFYESQLRPLLDRVPGVLGFGAVANGRLVALGNKRRVSYSGQVALSDGQLYLLSTGQELSAIQATLIGNGSWVRVEGLRAETGEGRLEAAGGLGFERWQPLRAQLGVVLRNLPLQREGLELASLTGSAALSTEFGPKVAQTAVKLHSLAIRLPAASGRSLQSLEPHPDVRVTTEKQKPPPEKPYVFEFFIDGQRGVTATRNDFDVELATELAVQYSDPDLFVGGYIEFRRGTFEVFGKQFEINRGSLQFDGGPEVNPQVNLIATQRPEAGAPTSDRVVARVTGTLAAPVVEFHSDTCPGQGAIVQLVSGRCPTDADSTLQDATGTQNAFAAGIVGGILTLGVRRELGGLIPRIAVESTGQGAQTRVKAGFEAVPKFMRPLVQRVYVQGALSTKDGTQVEGATADTGATPDFLIELYFPHNIVGSGRVAPTSRSWGLDVTWEP